MLIPKINPIRDEKFRRFVASLPCMKCKIEMRSQAAHFTKVGRGMKGGDDTCRPLCADDPQKQGCHAKFDQYKELEYWNENKQKALDLPLYDLWKRGEYEKAERLIRAF